MSKRSRSHRSRDLAQLIISFPDPNSDDENDALMESILTQSLLPYNVEHKEDDRDISFSNEDDCDSSLDSYDSYQLTLSYHLDDINKDDDLAEVMFGSPIIEDLLDKARQAGTIG
jgi:hypothetical protein